MSRKQNRPEKAAEGHKPKPKRKSDVVLIQGVSETGDAMAVIRAREDRVEAGIVRPVKEGEPVQGELVRLRPRPEFPLLCDVDVELPSGTVNATGGSEHKTSHNGPAQVATSTYRDNWDAIWNKKSTGKKPLLN